MVRNLRPGPDWIPGIVTEVLGPVTYLVDTDGGQGWKRHADQLKSWIVPVPEVDLSAEPEGAGDSDTAPFPEDLNSESSSGPETHSPPRSDIPA